MFFYSFAVSVTNRSGEDLKAIAAEACTERKRIRARARQPNEELQPLSNIIPLRKIRSSSF